MMKLKTKNRMPTDLCFIWKPIKERERMPSFRVWRIWKNTKVNVLYQCKGVSLPPSIYVDPPLLLPDCELDCCVWYRGRIGFVPDSSGRINKNISTVAWFMVLIVGWFFVVTELVSRAWRHGLGNRQWWISSHRDWSLFCVSQYFLCHIWCSLSCESEDPR